MRVAPPDYHHARLASLRHRLEQDSLPALLVTSAPNIAYLTGFFGSAGALLVGPDQLRLIVDGRYAESVARRKHDLPDLAVCLVPTDSTYEDVTAAEIGRLGCPTVGFEADKMTVSGLGDMTARLSRSGSAVGLEPTRGTIEHLRSVKDAWEVGRLREAAARLSDAAKCIMPIVLPGDNEVTLAGRIDQELRRVGFERPAFDTIVASGPNAAMPHYRAGDRRLETGDLVVLDFGGVLDGYAVDLTRTASVGPPGARERRLLDEVTRAQAAAFEAVRVGRPAHEVDGAARDVLDRAGLGDAFVHGTGHGLGLEVHERPRVARWRPGQPEELLEAGMVFTLEPGVYVPGWGGVRIEDDVLVTSEGGQMLTDVPPFYE